MSNSIARALDKIFDTPERKERFRLFMEWKKNNPEDYAIWKKESELDTLTTQSQWQLNESGYTFRPDCYCAQSGGWVQIDVVGKGKKLIYCTEHGCMQDSYNAWLQGEKNHVQGGVDYHQTFDVFRAPDKGELRDIFTAAKAWARGELQNILIVGSTGNGKTHLGHASTLYIMTNHGDVKFIRVPEMYAGLKSAMNSTDRTEYQRQMDYYKEIQFLVLDELKISENKFWELDTIEEILGSRYNDYKSTMINSNIDAQTLKDMAPRIWSRFNDIELSKTFVNNSPDYRTRKQRTTE